MKSPAEEFADLSAEEYTQIVNSWSDNEAQAFLYDWAGWWSRPEQRAPAGAWVTWLIKAGRGWGKTRVGAEWVRAEIESGRRGRLALVGRTAADVRDVIVEGESGILAICPPWNRPKYEPSKRKLTWVNGAMATLYSADEPDLLRGPQHDGAWADELAAWRFPDAWDQLMFGLRLGPDPRVVVTTTPRPTEIIRRLVKDPTTRITQGRSLDNRSNLPGVFFAQIVARYEGTRLGRQELEGELLDDNPNALWQRSQIDADRVRIAPEMQRIIVGVDPAVTSKEGSDMTGIVVAGADDQDPPHFYILDDLSILASPDEWAGVVVKSFHDWQADRVVAEVNNGGDLVEMVLRTKDANLSYSTVHATRGKAIRAEPVAALAEQHRLHHVGFFPELEDQLVEFDPSLAGQKSPDRMDALVWACTELMNNTGGWSALVNSDLEERRRARESNV